MKHFRLVIAFATFLFSLNLGLLENFISLNDLLRENRVYYFKENKDPVSGPVKTFWNNGYVENTGTLLNGLKEEAWEYFHDNGIGAVIKHIPGHGLAKVDSHNFTPVISKKKSYLMF